MKPEKAIPKESFDNCRKTELTALNQNFYNDCVVAQYKTEISGLIIIKGARKFFYYVYYHQVTFDWARKIERITKKEKIHKTLKIIEKKGRIHNRELWDQLLNEYMVENI